ncbi:EpsG family protein [Psychrobacter immobilis]|uniref:EpsG family protein n=1 Tax=Psychrobacter immobilis TaxID=498 RepID=UPI003FD1583E
MKISKVKISIYAIFTFVIMIFSYLVSTRDLSIGTDAINYRDYFLNVTAFDSSQYRHEPGYHYFNLLMYRVSDSFAVFLFVFYFLFNVIYIKSMNMFLEVEKKSRYIFGQLIFLILIFSSSWYQVATLNGLRQGFSLSLLFLSFGFAFHNKKYTFYLLLLLSCLFHYSTILILPFLFLLLLRLKWVISVLIITSVFYPLGINELLIRVVSDISNIPLHDAISSYAEGVVLWEGFQLIFFAYSVFWSVLFVFLHFVFLKNSNKSCFVLKVFLTLTTSYFVLGFGSFSNRFGYVSWMFLPVIQTFYLTNILINKKININALLIFVLPLLVYGFSNYFFILRP